MSATMFSSKQTSSNELQSRIPVSTPSPSPRRRSNSYRHEVRPCIRFSENANPPTGNSSRVASLMRGNSFSERGENNGRRSYVKYDSSARNVGAGARVLKTESRSDAPKGAMTLHTPRTKSLSLSLSNTKLNNHQTSPTVTFPPNTPPTSPYTNQSNLNCSEWDLDSASTTSNLSIASCDHACVARNGTTFSGRSMRYIFHCNQHAGATGEDYLTPTQRAHKQVKKLKSLLQQAQAELERKDSDILKLTKEVVELRLYKAALNSPEDKSNSSDAVTVRENNTDEQITPDVDGDCTDAATIPNDADLNNSCADSGHYDDLNRSGILDDEMVQTATGKVYSDKAIEACTPEPCVSSENDKLIMEYERRFHELIKVHEDETHQLKQKQNDKVEELLQRIADINQRYWQLVPEVETAKARIKELEQDLEETCKKLEDQEDKQTQTYLQMYNKGHEAAKLEQEQQVMELAKQNPSRVSVPELLQELQVTKNELDNIKDIEYASSSKQPLLSAKEALSLWVLGARKAMYRQLMEAKSKNKIDPEITLQFLKSAIYYFLTDKENTGGHLRAIQSILGFTPNEISNIDKARLQ